MDAKGQQVLRAALALSDGDRAAIVRGLIASLSPDVEDPTDEDWTAELDRRSTEYREDPSKAVPWSELKKRR